MKIIILGGGTAGFVTALVLKHSYPGFSVSVIKSSGIGTIGVGEGTTDHWSEFMDFCQISHADIIRHCGATFKSGIMFKDWCENDYLHSVENHFTETYNGIPVSYGCLAAARCHPREMVPEVLWDSKVTLSDNTLDNINTAPVNQYHFDTNLLAEFLEKISISRGIEVIDDTIVEIKHSDEEITEIIGSRSYTADFFIDCSGFSRSLISKLGGEWKSYSKHLQVDSAITFKTENQDYPMWTLAQAMSSGWMFSIPVQGRKGNGYVYSSQHISKDQAQAEVEALLGKPVEIAKHINFDPGKLDKTWIGNCVAIGLSSSFIEPLEASSIGSTIQQAFLLSEYLYAYDEEDVFNYNLKVNSIFDNIRDFVFLHYITPREDTEFWREQKQIEYPEQLNNNLLKWQKRLPTDKDFTSVTDRVLFLSPNFVIVLYSLGLLDSRTVKKQLSYLPANITQNAKQQLDTMKQAIDSTPKVSHETVINMIRDIE